MLQITLANDAALKQQPEHGTEDTESHDGSEYSSEQEAEKEPYYNATTYKKHPDVDGGWAYVVVVAGWLSLVIDGGMLSTTGIYYVQMLQAFHKDRSYTSWMGSLMNSFFLIPGPISLYFIHRCGTRAAVQLGSIITASGLFFSAFSTSLEVLFLTYGVIVAIGLNFVYTGQISAMNLYFDKYQPIATSLTLMGAGFGMFLVNLYTDYLIQQYAWPGSFILNAGLALQLFVLGSLIYPLHWPQVTSNGSTSAPSLLYTYVSSFFNSSGAGALSPHSLRESTMRILKDICFWLISTAFFFAMMSVTAVFVVYKDFMESKGFPEIYTSVLIGLGFADSFGRLSTGILHNNKYVQVNPMWSYSVVLFLCGLILIFHLTIGSVTSMYIISIIFGFFNGSLNVLVAFTPVKLFGKDKLVMVFCYQFFCGGVGSLIGAPIAGAMVDSAAGYKGVFGMTLTCLTIAAVMVLICGVIDVKRTHTDHQ